ncbi:putative transcriptional regulator, MarR family [Arcticibacter svalbardensis MN12-7]|uniref:Putative transcriptional regulator, MarR family n=1 Tax=Arcticibacter svalbardensis MN12-7 TaxID=1150600 RepID=R9H4W6_9SPHI|nr:MarR family winged helix-turn-helix transcriptional regulator [Arcticibacter svalbardensis]EOR96199.1 putative transcriptional regulator, MarR family [Arcticibacter svalbardensis MN12-7]
MSYILLQKLITQVEEFEIENKETLKSDDLQVFVSWLYIKLAKEESIIEPVWQGKEEGRTADSILNSLLLHLSRYAKHYSKMAILESPFRTIDEVIFLLNLLHSGPMGKVQLVDRNVLDKTTGIQIINRLLQQKFVEEYINEQDRRGKIIRITQVGSTALNEVMAKVRKASHIVSGNISETEKFELITLLQKLDSHHQITFKTQEI